MQTKSLKLGIIIVVLLLSFILVAVCAGAAGDRSPEQFYKGKTIQWIGSTGVGSATDRDMRIIAPFLARETKAKVMIRCMPGDAGMNYAYNERSKDGLTLLSKATSPVIFNDLLQAPGVKYKSDKFLYISEINYDSYVFCVNGKGSYQTLDQLRQAKGLKAAATSAKGAPAIAAAVLYEILKLDGKVITGFPGQTDMVAALMRDEVNVMTFPGGSIRPQVLSGDLKALFAIGPKRSQALPDVKTLEELGVKIPKELQDAYSAVGGGGVTAVMMPPGVPQNRVDYMRKTFDKLGQNRDIQALMVKLVGYFAPFTPGEELQKMMTQVLGNQMLGKDLDAILLKYSAVK